ncbi:MAG: HU family DNA-binding protein [Phycisphaeraceae bacterium]|jgi:nucleoid DNA-binding protein
MAKKKATKAAAAKPMTKSEVYRAVADATGLTRKQIVDVLDATTAVMVKEVKKKGSFNFIGLMKMTLVKKPAVKGGKLVRNPFTGEMVKQKPKPASKTVKVRPMKALKDQL